MMAAPLTSDADRPKVREGAEVGWQLSLSLHNGPETPTMLYSARDDETAVSAARRPGTPFD